MAEYDYHHYVPRFYLEAWTQNQQLTRYQWIGSRLEIRKKSPKRTAGLNHLYSLNHFPDDPNIMERELMGRAIDDPAAKVYQNLCNPLNPLSDDQRQIWTRFLMSLRVRMPDVIERLREDAETELIKNLIANSEEYNVLKRPNDPQNLYEFLDQRKPGFVADFGIRMLPELLNHQPIFKKIYEMYWWTHNFHGSSVSLLTSDRPLIIIPNLDDRSCVLALPLSPHLAFFATHDLDIAKRVASKPISRLARALNFDTVRMAAQFVYSVDSSQEVFIKRHFHRPSNT